MSESDEDYLAHLRKRIDRRDPKALCDMAFMTFFSGIISGISGIALMTAAQVKSGGADQVRVTNPK